jgi:hypothetical protein
MKKENHYLGKVFWLKRIKNIIKLFNKMKNVYFVKLDNDTIIKDIFSLINTIIYTINTNRKIIVFKNKYFDLIKMNYYLKKYNILLVDKNSINFKVNAVFYGEGENIIDITDMMVKVHIIPGNTYLSNIIVNDPSPGKPKQLYLNYSFGEVEFYETYDDYIEKDIYMNVNNVYEYQIIDKIDYFDIKLFNELIKCIYFNSLFNSKNNKNNKINVIDARLYYIKTKDNTVFNETFETMIDKMKEQIKLNINFNIDTFVICDDIINNPIIKFMNENNYNYMVNIKNDDFKENEINDIMSSRQCTDIFIGFFDIKKNIGSNFSYFINKNIEPCKKILIH